jgi:hypothetical protein
MRVRIGSAIALIVLLAGCDSDDGAGPADLPQGSMSARIDGANWSASAALTATYSNGLLAAAGVDAGARAIAFGLAATGTGTFTVGPTSTVNASFVEGAGGPTWQAVATLGSGSITLTTLTPTSAAGSFTFTLEANAASGATGTRTLASGTFNLRF